MRPFTVYLAGPITGLTYDSATDWRATAKQKLNDVGIRSLSPLRAQEHLRHVGVLTPDCAGYGEMSALTTPRGIFIRDRFDATTCNAIIVNLLGAERVSQGSICEISWAHWCRIPVVAVMERQGNLHDHIMVTEQIDFRVTSLDDAINVVKAIADAAPVGTAA
ncbi:nucleoside 2-deoxyribosyltransferase [Bradyrhizobium sp. PMVTL-01]|uniref:nucleoside 2-deoxyribosyltransferase n=1 Tax=Bradyrhizobium sp. PMVTL-01 TaxID=3434999 RepID=UPI003F710F34